MTQTKSKNENLRKLPESWDWTTLGDVCKKPQYGWTTKATNQGEFHLLRTTDITSGSINWDTVPYCTDEPEDKRKYLLEDGDIVISRAGSVGFSSVIRNPQQSVFASYLIRFKPLIQEDFVGYFLQSPNYWRAISEEKLGIAIPNVNATKLKKIKFPLPPLPEQQRIVAKIEELFTQLDAGVAALQRAQANLKRYKGSLLKAACEGRLVPTEAQLAQEEGRHYEPAGVLLKRILDARRAKWEADLHATGKDPAKRKYNQPAAPDTTELPDLPEGWVWATVEQLGAIDEQAVLTGPFGSNLGKDDFIDEGVPVLTIGSLTEKGINLEKAKYISEQKSFELKRYKVFEGDLLFSRMATVGRAGLVTKKFEGTLINYHLMRLRLSNVAIIPDYFIAYVRGSSVVTNYVRDVNHGATRDGINTRQLLKLPVPVPPIDEQIRIVWELDKKISIAQEQEQTFLTDISRSNRLRQAILKRAFAGQLVPQDPDDEPASVLLERIKEK